MPDLGELLSHAERALEDGYAGRAAEPAGVAGARAQIRRRRRARHAGQSAGAVAALGLVVAGAWIGVGQRHVPVPAVTPTPTPSIQASRPAETATPSAMPSATPSATATSLITAPHLPPYRPLTADVLARVGPGWVVTLHDPAPLSATGALTAPIAVLLASPSGELYRAADVVDAREDIRAVRWSVADPGSIVVENAGLRARLDLSTGILTPDARGIPDGQQYVGTAFDGREIWTGDGTYVLGSAGQATRLANVHDAYKLSPDGRRLVLEGDPSVPSGTTLDVADLRTGQVSPVPGFLPAGMAECFVQGWLTSSMLVESCGPGSDQSVPGDGAVIATVRLDGGASTTTVLRQYGKDEPRMGWVHWVRDGLVVGSASRGEDCDDGVYTWDSRGTAKPLQRPTTFGENMWTVDVLGDAVYVHAQTGCSGEPFESTLTLHDLSSGSATVLSPLPADANPDLAVEGLSSFAVMR